MNLNTRPFIPVKKRLIINIMATCIALVSLSSCTSAQRSVRQDARDRSDLAENAELYWRAVRWANLPAAASYFADSEDRMS